jgi:hypothetical protein
MSNFRLVNANGTEINQYPTRSKAERIQEFYEDSVVQELIEGEWVNVS